MSTLARRLVVAALMLEVGHGLLVASQGRASRVVDAVAILLGTFAVYLISVFLVLNRPPSGEARELRLWVILLPALIFRLTAWWLEPSFTDDLYRYRWESRLQLAGGNPYAMPPKDPSVAGLRDETYARIPGHDFRAVYGPLTEHVYREAFRLIQYSTGDPARQIFWLKLPSAVFELGLMAGLWGLLGALGIARERILIYAWAPLPIFEFWGNGHNDTLALCALVLALLAAVKHRWTLAFLTLGLSAAAKIWPLGLVPLFWRPSRWRESLVLPVAGILLMLPFGEGLLSNVRFLSGFLGGWRNNDSLYGLLLWATGDQYLAKYLAFALVFGAILLAVVQSMSLTKGTLLVTTVMLLVSANCHPWYVTWLLPMLVFHPSLALLAWSGLIPLAYRVLPAWQLLGEWNGSTPMRWLVYGPVFALLAWEWWKLIRGRVKKILAA